ncbi:uncharacterized protein GGS25DRAFT_305539 [Hypoxylon fragiforme]|uniref:uncharacterized protein n=1 Tax=Hypoxylon fragiforme TaxID=63214 RepID=UPI0020C71F60|nr:uncharacterized protein GGS25DRAFT_305539 [Hypoxylon fragiforme]KAI2609121.1 hypothetical protein GGS25DRAFT_305539 [Hypoxylon fragiforme]
MRQSPQLLQHLHPANMCTYYYLHYHHLAPCTRDVEYAVHYSFCPNAIPDISSANPPSSVNTGVTEHGEQWIQQPCEGLTYAPEYSPVEGVDYNSPCATGGCLVSHKCSSGGCRLEDLGGSWTCCQCNRGGNTLRWCIRPMKKIPDSLCYHAICQECRPDQM